MEPQQPSPVEQAPASKPERSETGNLPPAEQAPPSQEKLTPAIDRSAQAGPPVPILPTPQATPVMPPAVDQALDVPVAGSGPAVADDVDVIEKEWVDKAKTIVNNHRHDPYNQEKEASKLQADYLKKRYGKDVKLAE